VRAMATRRFQPGFFNGSDQGNAELQQRQLNSQPPRNGASAVGYWRQWWTSPPLAHLAMAAAPVLSCAAVLPRGSVPVPSLRQQRQWLGCGWLPGSAASTVAHNSGRVAGRHSSSISSSCYTRVAGRPLVSVLGTTGRHRGHRKGGFQDDHSRPQGPGWRQKTHGGVSLAGWLWQPSPPLDL